MAKTETEVLSQGQFGAVDAEKISGQIRKVIDQNSAQSGALIRVLQQVQGIVGYLPPQVLKSISKEMKVPLSEVYGIVSFYSFFSMVPKGKYIIQVCMGTSCYVKGGERLLTSLKKDMGLEPEGITPDGRFSLETVRCLGCCGLSPVMAVGKDIHSKVRVSEIQNILSSYR
jgi:NADH:ubiquinone oxidoreductase subunit E